MFIGCNVHWIQCFGHTILTKMIAPCSLWWPKFRDGFYDKMTEFDKFSIPRVAGLLQYVCEEEPHGNVCDRFLQCVCEEEPHGLCFWKFVMYGSFTGCLHLKSNSSEFRRSSDVSTTKSSESKYFVHALTTQLLVDAQHIYDLPHLTMGLERISKIYGMEEGYPELVEKLR